MSDLRVPNITAKDSTTQMVQLKSYLYQLVEQLNYTIGLLEQNIREAGAKSEADDKAILNHVDVNRTAIKNVFDFANTNIIKLNQEALLLSSVPTEPGMYKLGAYRSQSGKAEFMWFEGL